MRLLHFDDHGVLNLTKNLINDIPQYAILSHTWGADEDEVKFSDLQDGSYKSKEGYKKIQFCGQQAQRDGLQYFWVDTCCINKADSSELAEAIVSMFKWYSNAAKCYAFLSDVGARKRRHDSDGAQNSWEPAFRESRWFTRGWTLQELLAPTSVEFFSNEWEHLGDKKTLERVIHEITTIPQEALWSDSLGQFSDSERLRWVEKRKTTRIEDKAYCLQGIFGVHILPMYGEEEKSFDRLKDAISASHRKRLDKIGQPFETLRLTRPETPGSQSTSIHSQPALLHDHRKKLLASLGFEQMASRQSTIKNAFSTTCRWLLKHPVYLTWGDRSPSRQQCDVLWINAKPGAGKSTLVKFAHAHAKKERPQHEILVSFFFNARGNELERTTVGMYRSLLHQLLEQAPDL